MEIFKSEEVIFDIQVDRDDLIELLKGNCIENVVETIQDVIRVRLYCPDKAEENKGCNKCPYDPVAY